MSATQHRRRQIHHYLLQTLLLKTVDVAQSNYELDHNQDDNNTNNDHRNINLHNLVIYRNNHNQDRNNHHSQTSVLVNVNVQHLHLHLYHCNKIFPTVKAIYGRNNPTIPTKVNDDEFVTYILLRVLPLLLLLHLPLPELHLFRVLSVLQSLQTKVLV